jgi:hypothetical protein
MRLLLLFVPVVLGASPQAPSQAAAISVAKNAVVQDMEKTQPRETFEVWVQRLAGAPAALKWSTNDCGEQTGNPTLDKGRDLPICAEVQVALAGDRQLSLSLVVGSTSRGLTVGPPMFRQGNISGPQGSETFSIRRLSDVPKLIGPPAKGRLRTDSLSLDVRSGLERGEADAHSLRGSAGLAGVSGRRSSLMRRCQEGTRFNWQRR